MLAAFILFDLAAFNWVESGRKTEVALGDRLRQIISLQGAADFVKQQPGLHRVRVGVEPQPNVGDVYGIESIWGGGATVLTDYSKLGLHDDLLNVRYVIKPAASKDPEPIYQDAKWKVYNNPAAFPRAWIVHEAMSVPSQEAAFRQLDQQDLHRFALIETSLPQPLKLGNPKAESVHFRSWAPESFSMDVIAATSGLLVLSEMYYPGWVAKVNGHHVQIYRADGALRAIPVSAGQNKIEMEYAPSSFRFGAIITLLTLAVFLGGWFFVRRRIPLAEP
jgi:hypothetical protein